MDKSVFSDLGFSNAEAVALQARVTLAVEIERFFENEWTDTGEGRRGVQCAAEIV